jgi:CheY-specific phosphatase CheX
MKASEFAGLIPECCSEVLDAMYFATMLGSERVEDMPTDSPGAPAALAFSLKFAGDVSGHFGLYLEQVTARSLAANFLGVEEAEVSSDEIGEVAGELANMLCGSIVSRVEGEHKFVLSHPERADTLPFKDLGDVFILRLDMDSGAITVWISVEGVPCCL